ncbi:MAG TPA: hypothetical protein VFT84_08870 [Gemmatimonadales bacterium]|nr:hypothetical protein [Gemmatimonadales bacterium]
MPARRPALAALVAPVLLVLGSAAPAAAQTSATAAWRATPASLLKSTLRGVAAAQSRYQASRGTFAASATPLGVALEPGVRVEILAAGPTGWQGRATHRDQPGRSCVIFVGRLEGVEAPRTDGDREMAGEDGVPLCDRMQ